MAECLILVVDDEATVRRVLQRCLAGPGRRILAAENGESALELARQQPPHLVILDLFMPKMDGYQTCRALRADPRLRRVPILVVTGHLRACADSSLVELGADDYLSKPFDLDEIRARASALLKRHGGEGAQGRRS